MNYNASRQRHLILGGTRGIGYAYARWHAKSDAELILIGRSETNLHKARLSLERDGAEVVPSQIDLLDSTQLSHFLLSIPRNSLKTILVGGPSPPPGTLFNTKAPDGATPSLTLSHAAFANAVRICLEYPFQVLHWAISNQSACERIVVLSSSASTETTKNHPFWTSAVLRRTLENVIGDIVDSPVFAGNIAIWRPIVVWTSLAENYASTLDSDSRLTDRDKLALEFGVSSIPSPDEYVAMQMRGSISKTQGHWPHGQSEAASR